MFFPFLVGSFDLEIQYLYLFSCIFFNLWLILVLIWVQKNSLIPIYLCFFFPIVCTFSWNRSLPFHLISSFVVLSLSSVFVFIPFFFTYSISLISFVHSFFFLHSFHFLFISFLFFISLFILLLSFKNLFIHSFSIWKSWFQSTYENKVCYKCLPYNQVGSHTS